MTTTNSRRRTRVTYRPRSLPMQKPETGAGAVAVIVASLFALFWIISDLWWSIWIWLGVSLSGAEPWSYWHVVTHWGLLAPIIGAFIGPKVHLKLGA